MMVGGYGFIANLCIDDSSLYVNMYECMCMRTKCVGVCSELVFKSGVCRLYLGICARIYCMYASMYLW